MSQSLLSALEGGREAADPVLDGVFLALVKGWNLSRSFLVSKKSSEFLWPAFDLLVRM